MPTELAALLAVDQLIAGNRSRATGAGIDADEYDLVTASLGAVGAWTPTLTATAAEHVSAGERSESVGHRVSAGESYLAAARWAHFATCWPNPDRRAHRTAAALAAASYRRALAMLDPDAVWLDQSAGDAPFVGVLRRPKDVANPHLVLIIGGLDSGKEEFHYVAEALLARGLATFAFDGPGQAELSGSTVIDAAFDRVTARVLDHLGTQAELGIELTRVGAIALSLGGYYGVRVAAHDRRIGALVTVSGANALDWDSLPGGVIELFTQRAGSAAGARAFADAVDSVALARTLGSALLVVAGGDDPMPTPLQARAVAAAAPLGELHLVDGGDHLLANRQWQWIPVAGDWLVDRLA